MDRQDLLNLISGKTKPLKLSLRDIQRWYKAIRMIGRHMPTAPLRRGDLSSVGNLLRPDALPFLTYIAWAMRGDPALFADVPIDPKELLARQVRAELLLSLSGYLAMLSQRALELSKNEQVAAMTDGLTVFRQVRAELNIPHLRERAERRLFLLIPAARHLGRWFR